MTPPSRESRVPSPCTGICRIDDETGICAGCLRTLGEIAAWSTLDDVAKHAIWQALLQRRDGAGTGTD